MDSRANLTVIEALDFVLGDAGGMLRAAGIADEAGVMDKHYPKENKKL